ncbi:uncharacterized protein [Watersipora subatra]|uniref:uncharacterized protein n=1 Tax=Watersipora subatra TaxID=2589382 RepID=UPI00355C81ED
MSSLLVNLLISSFLVGLLAAQELPDGVTQSCDPRILSCETVQNPTDGDLCRSDRQPVTDRLDIIHSAEQEVNQEASVNETLHHHLSFGLEITSHPDCPLLCVSLGWPTLCGGYIWYYYNGNWWLIWHIPGFPFRWRCWCSESSCRPHHPFGSYHGRCVARRPRIRYVIVIDLATGKWKLVPVSLNIGCNCRHHGNHVHPLPANVRRN